MDLPVLVNESWLDRQVITRLDEKDRGWCVDLCKRKYPPHYDTSTAEAWIINVVLKNPLSFYATRTNDAFQITNISSTAWTPTILRADIVAVCADTGKMWQVLPLLKDSIRWAKERKIHIWRFETETEFDLTPIMHRLGAKTMTPRWNLEL